LDDAETQVFDIRKKFYMKRIAELEHQAGDTRKHQKVSISEEERLELLHMLEPEILPHPGLRDIKQMELYVNYRKLVPEAFWDALCPKPSDEVLQKHKKERNVKLKQKKELKNLMGVSKAAKAKIL
jgi:hypothetical protein